MDKKLTATRRCLLMGRTEGLRKAARLITGLLSAVGNKILITLSDAAGSSRQMDVGFSAILWLSMIWRISGCNAQCGWSNRDIG